MLFVPVPTRRKSDEIIAKVEQDRHVGRHNISKELNSQRQTVLNHLKKTGYKKKLDVRVPHESTQKIIYLIVIYFTE